jgi:RimJ/RimL family protein N-acetyltransferase
MLKQTKETYLRPFEPDQAKLMYDWFYDKDNAHYFFEYNNTMKVSDCAEHAKGTAGWVFVIYDADGDLPIGMVSIYDVKWKAKVAKIGIFLVRDKRTSGFSKDAMMIASDFIFNEMGFEKLVFETLACNTLAQKILDGYLKQEAILFDEAMFEGKRMNTVRYFVMKQEAVKILNNFWR